jgi:hypothetical protein
MQQQATCENSLEVTTAVAGVVADKLLQSAFLLSFFLLAFYWSGYFDKTFGQPKTHMCARK